MVFTIHRYIFRDLLKTFLLTTVVLSAVLGLGVMLRPLREFSVAPTLVPQLILCTMPITVTMVAPIAALLAATLNYGRLAVDNEISACRASGISVWTLIYPALTLALLVGMGTLVMVFHIIPTYTERFEGIIKEDVEAMIYRSIERSGSLWRQLPRWIIHADHADPENHRLIGVAAIRRSSDGTIEETFTAEQVIIDVQTGHERNKVFLRFVEPTVIGTQSEFVSDNFVVSADMPSLWKDSINFKKLADLKAIEGDMTRFSPIRKMLDEFRQNLIAEQFLEYCNDQLVEYGSLELPQGPGGKQRIVVEANSCRVAAKESGSPFGRSSGKREALLSPHEGNRIVVGSFHHPDDAQPERLYQADAARLVVNVDHDPPTVKLALDTVEWRFADDEMVHKIEAFAILQLGLMPEIVSRVAAMSLQDILAEPIALSRAEPSKQLTKLHAELREECADLAVEIAMERHSRLAFGVSCVVLVLLGAALGIVFRSGHLLTAFGVSFLPAAVCLITIFTGKHIAEDNAGGITLGIMFLWSGIVAVAIANTIIYKTILRR